MNLSIHIHTAQPEHGFYLPGVMPSILGEAPAAPVVARLTPPEPNTYWPGQGGIFIATMPALPGLRQRHLIAGTAEHEGLAYGGDGHTIVGADSQYDGKANTAALLASSHAHPAAQWAAGYTADGHSDFFLPARLDLLIAFIVARAAFNPEGWYATSSQYSAHDAWCQDFRYGFSLDSGSKVADLRVRPVRTILA